MKKKQILSCFFFCHEFWAGDAFSECSAPSQKNRMKSCKYNFIRFLNCFFISLCVF
ncbi:hypothetical protein ANACAC_03203 [Anaerostipes caccae L1-92]|uniref:Uncharacterized protein n=1 Tax=Anaerostipes caccae (strain DSM 14662 / CCUG 47493 / JCM 13470 / NCIMB 13811 / L1-92) TaxID=411490 RepID=B0MGW6_ANACD|nr:hypothetical protein ANACAC_03203 [Anaerostipes caccae L1-92]